MLENTLYALTHHDHVNISYFGGSITEGAGANPIENCWAVRVNNWFQEQYPQCKINRIQSSIGGTGSTLGIYRCDRDVIAHHPDLVFFEFAVNDAIWGKYTFETYCNNTETILRKIWTANPYADIVMIYTTAQSTAESVAHGTVRTSMVSHEAVAFYYGGIPQIDVGAAITDAAHQAPDGWKSLLTDGVHPNNEGHGVYAKTVTDCIADLFAKAKMPDAPSAKVLKPSLFGDKSYIRATMTDAWDITDCTGFTKVDESFVDRFPHYLEGVEPGSELTFAFDGCQVELYYMIAKDSGRFEYQIDGGAWQTREVWDQYAKGFNRAGNSGGLMAEETDGHHILKLRILPDHAEESLGTALRIAAFMTR